MRAIGLVASKGGTGKSTLAIHLAVLAGQAGLKVALIDLDPQRSAGDWWRARQAATPVLVETGARQLRQVLAAARRDGLELAVLDAPPHADADAAAAAAVADLVLIPTRPGVLDLRAVARTVASVKAAGRRAAFVLNACPPPGRTGDVGIVREAREALAAYGLPVAPVAISQRAALSHALIDGRAVSEFEPAGKAAAELLALWQWARKELKA